MLSWCSLLSLALYASAAAERLFVPAVSAQIRPVYSRGAVGLVEVLKRLQTTASMMHTGAHPDDEDTALITRAARGDHARVAYLSLNRGEGGQNIIGLELFDALGVVRTEELLQARTLDGGEQFFTSAYDFGFTKTLEEAATKWGQEHILGEMVRAIRLYRPLVLVSRFAGTPADGHGQHQLAGLLTPLAYAAAADPSRFPEHMKEGLRPWQVKKLYVGEGFRESTDNTPTLRLPVGVYDALLGRTYYEIAMEGRSQHKSQQMGMIERRGPQFSGLRLAASALPPQVPNVPGIAEVGLFDGLDTSVPGLARLVGLPEGALREYLATMERTAATAIADLDVTETSGVVPLLAEGLRAARGARTALKIITAPDAERYEADMLLAHKEAEFEEALVRAMGLTIDALADREVAAPGESIRVVVQSYLPATYAPQAAPVRIGAATLRVPQGWAVTGAPNGPGEADDNPMARFFRETPTRADAFTVRVAKDARFTEPYWLEPTRKGYVFDGAEPSMRNKPFAPPIVRVDLAVEIGGAPITLTRPIEFRYADSIRGELRRPFSVVPALTVSFDSQLEMVPLSELGKPRRIAVRLQSQTMKSANGVARLTLPPGWTSQPAEAQFSVTARGERTAVVFRVTPGAGAKPGGYQLAAEAVVNNAMYRTSMQTVEYPHIQTHRLYDPAIAAVRVLDLKVAPVRVGYVMGSGDLVPDAIRRMGLDVAMIDGEQLAAGDLSRFDTIVVGIRASESRPEFVSNNGRLLQFVKDGGTLIVQYQQPDFVARGLTPLPAEMPSRVTDEAAPVTILQPKHPRFTFPNRITDDDFKDWVQERNLYAFSAFDPQYVPLLETQDPDEPPQRGGEVYLRLGKGHYVYTSFAWFRQLPAGVPGAYRLFANLLSLAKAEQ